MKNMRTQFPKKTFAKAPSKVVTIKRLIQFRKFLRELSSILCMNSFHPSTTKVQLAFQDFLGVTAQMPRLLRKERAMIVDLVRNTVEVYVHSILHMRVMDPVLYGHVDRFLDKCSQETGHWKAASWTEAQGKKLLNELADFITNLQDVIAEGIAEDCGDVVTKMVQTKEVRDRLLFQRKIHLEQYERRERRYQQQSVAQSKSTVDSESSAPSVPPAGRKRAGTQLAFDSFTGVHAIAPGSHAEPTHRDLVKLDSNGAAARRRSSYAGASSPRDQLTSATTPATISEVDAESAGPRLGDSSALHSASSRSFSKRPSMTDARSRVRAQSLAEFLDITPMAAPEELIIDDAKIVTELDTDEDLPESSRPRPVSMKRAVTADRETGRPTPSDHVRATTKVSELVISAPERDGSPFSTASAESNSSGSVFSSFKRNVLGGSSHGNQDEVLTENERNMTDIPNAVDLGDIHNFYTPSENDRDNEELTSLLSSRQASTLSAGFQALDLSVPNFEKIQSFLSQSAETVITASSGSSDNERSITVATSNIPTVGASDTGKLNTGTDATSSSAPTAEDPNPVFFSEDDIESMIREAVRKQVEVEVYTPSLEVLRAVLVVSFRDRELDVERKIDYLYTKSQDDFGIRAKLQSPSGWAKVIDKFRTIRRYLVPIDKLRVLLKVSTMIPELIEEEHPSLLDPIGADDFLPIFIYVLVKARITQVVYLNQELQSICAPDKKLGEIGYYLATLDAAIQHLDELDINGGAKLMPSWHYEESTD